MKSQFKKAGKNLFSIFGATQLLNELNFRFQQIGQYNKNRQYQPPLKRFVFPTDRALFNTYHLDYKKYYEDGLLAADEITSWGEINKFTRPVILDWGCGTGRVIRHIPQIQKEAICYGADIDSNSISWCRQHIESVYFDCIENQTLPYPSNYFNLVYGISVFTHIPSSETTHWLDELNRVLMPNGIAILSTHGSNYTHQLNPKELEQLKLDGIFTNHFKQKGHRLMTTYHESNFLTQLIQKQFTISQFWAGNLYPKKMGGQDCWIIKKIIPATNGNRD
jgi:ubiquinone/menaquinone biosynthesis C-methylase UbiE